MSSLHNPSPAATGDRSVLTKKTWAWLLLPIPLVWLALCVWQRSWGGGAFLALSQDPNYSYLFNGLSLATGHFPTLCDHPGTPVFIYWAGLLRLAHPFLSADSLAARVLANPESYIANANGLLVLFFAVILATGGWRVAQATGSMPAGLIFQLAPLLTVQGAEALSGVKPEPVLLICGVGISALLVCQATVPVEAVSGKRLCALGILLGIGVAAKAHFLPLILPAMAVLPDWRSRRRLAIWLVAAFAVATIPSWPSLARFAGYVWRSSTHTGPYGSGRTGLPGLSVYFHNLVFLVKTDKSFFAMMALAVLCAPFAIRRQARLIAAILAAQIFSVIVIAQHPSRHYLTASVSLAGAQAVLTFLALKARRKGAVPLLGVLLIPLLFYRVSNLRSNRRLTWVAKDERDRLAETLRRDYGDAVTAPYFQRSDPDFALYYGDVMSNHLFNSALAARLNRRLVFDRFDNRFHRGAAVVPDVELRSSGRELILAGLTLSPEDTSSKPAKPLKR